VASARAAAGQRSAVKDRPADVVPQPLVVKYEIANRLRELVTLPPALKSPCAFALALGRASTCGLDRIGGRTEFVRGDVRDGPGLASSVRGMACRPTQVSSRGHGVPGRRASLGHLHLATHPGAGLLDRLTRSWVLRLGRLEEVEDVLRARCRPTSEEPVIRIGEGPAAADRHEARIPGLREDHGQLRAVPAVPIQAGSWESMSLSAVAAASARVACTCACSTDHVAADGSSEARSSSALLRSSSALR
jgi:hypothetical protein